MSRRYLPVLVALAGTPSGCESRSSVARPPATATGAAWLYPPAPLAWPAGAPRGVLGRSLAPQRVSSLGLAPVAGAHAATPLRLATPFASPSGDTGTAASSPVAAGTGPGLAVLWGQDGDHAAIEGIDIDGGRVLWRDGESCTGPVVGVTTDTAVCMHGTGVRGVSLDGARHWDLDRPYLAMTEERIAVVESDGIAVHDASDGTQLGHVKLPAGVAVAEVFATCGESGREVFAMRQDGTLARIADGKGGPTIAWAVPIPQLVELDACAGDTVLARVTETDGSRSAVLAFARSTGAATGRVDDVRGWWAARDGSAGIEMATSGGIVRAPRSLATQAVISPLVLGTLLATRGERRLVRATPATAVLLDSRGVASYLPFAWPGAALGAGAILGADWTGVTGSVARVGIPPRELRAVRIPAARRAVPVPAELRDLPAAVEVAPSAIVEAPHTAMDSVIAVTLAPEDGATIAYVLATEASDGGGGIIALDLATRAVLWHRADACGLGVPVAIAVAHETVMCATRRASPTGSAPQAVVRATTRSGLPSWEWTGEHADVLQAAGSVVVASGADRAVVLDAATGLPRGSFASDDGGPPRVIAVSARHSVTYVIAAERGQLVARVATVAMTPVWSLAVGGVVQTLAPSDHGMLVALEDGDAFRVEVDTARVTPIAGLDLEWGTTGELIAGTTLGGPIPGAPLPPPAAPRLPRGPRRRGAPPPPTDVAAVWTPRPLPTPLGQAWHLALYEPSGEFRVRNEYPIFPPISPSRLRASGTAPLVVVSGPEQREALVIDPRTGDPLRRATLSVDATPAITGGLLIHDRPVAFAVYARPLRVALF